MKIVWHIIHTCIYIYIYIYIYINWWLIKSHFLVLPLLLMIIIVSSSSTSNSSSSSSSGSSSSSDKGLLLYYSKMFQLHRPHSEKRYGKIVSKNLICRQPWPISGYYLGIRLDVLKKSMKTSFRTPG